MSLHKYEYFNLIHLFTDFFFAFIQVIEIEKSAGRFYKIISQNQPVFKFINYHRDKGKYCIKYIYFYNIKFTKYMKFTKFKI